MSTMRIWLTEIKALDPFTNEMKTWDGMEGY